MLSLLLLEDNEETSVLDVKELDCQILDYNNEGTLIIAVIKCNCL